MVDMDAGCRLARTAARVVAQARHPAALQMVEDEHAAGAGVFLEKRLGLRVVDPANLVVVPEILDRGAVLDQAEAFAVEVQLVLDGRMS